MDTLTTSSFFFENKSETTKQALRDLNEQLKQKLKSSQVNNTSLQHPKRRRSESDEEDDIEEETVLEYEQQKKKVQKKPQFLSKIDATTFVTLQKTIEKLKSTIKKQSDELDGLDISLYQTKLELSNTSIDLGAEKDKTEKLTKENKELLKCLRHSNFWCYASWLIYFLLQCFCSGSSILDWITSPWAIVVAIIIVIMVKFK